MAGSVLAKPSPPDALSREPLFRDRTALGDICRRYHIRRLSLFGSRLRSSNRPDSDIDLLVEFEEGQKPGLFGLARIEAELSALLQGDAVDLRTAEDLSRHFRMEIVNSARQEYAGG